MFPWLIKTQNVMCFCSIAWLKFHHGLLNSFRHEMLISSLLVCSILHHLWSAFYYEYPGNILSRVLKELYASFFLIFHLFKKCPRCSVPVEIWVARHFRGLALLLRADFFSFSNPFLNPSYLIFSLWMKLCTLCVFFSVCTLPFRVRMWSSGYPVCVCFPENAS